MTTDCSIDAVLRRFSSLIVGAIFLCAAIPLLMTGASYLRTEYLFAEYGITVKGTASMKFSERGAYFVLYRFTTADGVTLEGRDRVHQGLWESIDDHGPVTVRYLRGDPARNRIEGNISTRVLAAGFMFMGGLCLLLGGVALARAYRKMLRQARVSREGVVVEGTVVSLRLANLRIDDAQQWTIRYAYRDDGGTVHEAESEPLSFEEARTWRQGDKCRVLMNPERPEESRWAGRAEGDERG